MTADIATDSCSPPVEYYFECTNYGDANSIWQENNPTYVAMGLDPNTLYTFWVRARDSAIPPNITDWSDPASATTSGGPPPTDNTKPLPDPSQWLLEPEQYYSDGYYRHRMSAVLTSDATTGGSEPCQYEFDLVSGGIGPHDSGWQLSNVYDYPVSALNPNQYGVYKVRAKDAAGNITGWSELRGTLE